jgi:hypothetical protein
VDDLAPAPAQRTSDEGGPRPDELFVPRKRVTRKVAPAPAPEKEPEAEPNTEHNHEIDVMA